MASVNKVILIGNLTRDPQTKSVGQSTVAEFGLAVNRTYKTASGEKREEATFVDVSAWGKQAEVMAKYLTKGKQVYIEGRLKLDTWEDKKDGSKRSKLSVVVENFQFLGGKGDGDGGGGGKGRDAGGGSPISEDEQFKDDDIPF